MDEVEEEEKRCQETRLPLRILQYNLFMRPWGIHCNGIFKGTDWKDLRMRLFVENFLQKDVYDLLFFQELFGGRQGEFASILQKAGFPYTVCSPQPTLMSKQLMNGGILIASRYPIVEQDDIIYKNALNADGIVAKGALYAKLILASKEDLICGEQKRDQDKLSSDTYLHAFTTHLQAGEDEACTEIRWSQIVELCQFISQKLQEQRGQRHRHSALAASSPAPVVIGGDFNLDAIGRGPGQEDSNKYCSMVNLFRRTFAEHGYIFVDLLRESTIEAARYFNPADAQYDLSPDGLNGAPWSASPHPITNGHGHGKMYWDMKGQPDTQKCIDYMFYAEYNPVAAKHIDSADTVMINALKNEQLLIPALSTRVIPFRSLYEIGTEEAALDRPFDRLTDTKVEEYKRKGVVDIDADIELLSPEHYFTRLQREWEGGNSDGKLPAPLRQLSDHFGVQSYLVLPSLELGRFDCKVPKSEQQPLGLCDRIRSRKRLRHVHLRRLYSKHPAKVFNQPKLIPTDYKLFIAVTLVIVFGVMGLWFLSNFFFVNKVF